MLVRPSETNPTDWNQKENENKAILRDIALFKKGKNSRLGNISPMIINEINTKTKFKKSVEN